ncbi:MAG TPA: hypothetical protein VMT35_07675 [Ignavibacteriaceae bacterium]|nr:hypothetical protein [Ignavibacteriaceae bacterium]
MLRTSIPTEFRNGLIFLLFLLFSLTLISCSKEAPKKTGVTIKDGILYELSSNKLFTGKITDTLKNQIMSYEVVDGKKNGMFILKGLNGKTLMEGLIKDNKNEGKWRYYYPTGQMESEGNFANDTVEGKWTWYYEDGTIKEEGHYKNGKREGIWILYDEKGKVKTTMNFKEGERVSQNNQKDYYAVSESRKKVPEPV